MLGFEFKKFKPDSDLAICLNTSLLRLVDYIPNGMIVAASLTKMKEKYQCEIVVRTRDTDFIQDNSSYDPSLAVEKATESLQTQMVDWKVKNMKMTESSFWDFEKLDTKEHGNDARNKRRRYGSEKIH